MSKAKVQRKRAGSVHETKRLDDGAIDTARTGSYINPIHPKWEKVINDEERDNVTLQIREEIFESLFNICYEKYLERQVIDFTVHCAHQAFLKVASVYFIKLDPGEKLVTDNPSWTPDKEPEPSPMDPWLSYTVPVVQQKPKEEPEAPSAPAPSPVTEASPSSASAPKLADEKKSGSLSQQLYERYQPSTEWSPAMVESVLRHSTEPAKPKAPAESPPKGQTKRSPASSRKSKEAAPPLEPAPLLPEPSDIRRTRLPPIKSKAELKKAKSRAASPGPMEIPRPPVLALSALPPSRAEVKCTVVPFKGDDTKQSELNVKKQPSGGRKKATSVRWSKSTKDVS